MKKTLLLACLLLQVPAALMAGAWTLPRRGVYWEEAVSFFQTDRDLTSTGEGKRKNYNGVYNDFTWKTYVEYGLRERWTLIGTLPHRQARYVDDYNDINYAGFQDLNAGLKWGWRKKKWIVSFTGIASIPTGYTPSAPLGKSLGTGRGNLDVRIVASRELKNLVPGTLYVTGEAGKDRYGVPYALEAFWLHAKWIYTKLYINGIQAWPSHWNSQEYTQWTLSAGLTSRGRNVIMRSAREQSFGLSAGYGRPLRGRNTGRGDTLSLSVAYVF